MTTVARPFAAIPSEAAGVLRPVLPALADEMIAAIAVEVPDYARAMEGEFGHVVRLGVERALGRFVDLIEAPGGDERRGRQTYVALGRGEMRAGRGLDALLAAYRVGARLAWRRFVEAGVAGGLAPADLYALGEAMFAYIDELSAESAEGYAEEQSAAAGERQRLRQRLVRLVVQEPPGEEEAVRAAAAAAGWSLPRLLAALVTTGPADDDAQLDAVAARLARRTGEGAIGADVGGLACVLVPDPDAPGRRRRLKAASQGRAVALGPTVDLARAGTSVRRAAATHALLAAGRLGDSRFAAAEDHMPALVLSADPALAAELAERLLTPLTALADGPRARLTETLRAWLDRPGQVQAVAGDLGVHPQTVRYRLRQLHELFGERLDHPEGRFELALALRVA
ncbi:MAG TPA: helix-turn-helix domain-containing protein [Solirubrobacteraceae bacterium]|nr:helix-turn-helix domain-containing protein [Solirubrobacteraceae bacterium]